MIIRGPQHQAGVSYRLCGVILLRWAILGLPPGWSQPIHHGDPGQLDKKQLHTGGCQQAERDGHPGGR